jgi:hypothetical protein
MIRLPGGSDEEDSSGNFVLLIPPATSAAFFSSSSRSFSSAAIGPPILFDHVTYVVNWMVNSIGHEVNLHRVLPSLSVRQRSPATHEPVGEGGAADHARPGHAKPSHAKPSHAKPSHARPRGRTPRERGDGSSGETVPRSTGCWLPLPHSNERRRLCVTDTRTQVLSSLRKVNGWYKPVRTEIPQIQSTGWGSIRHLPGGSDEDDPSGRLFLRRMPPATSSAFSSTSLEGARPGAGWRNLAPRASGYLVPAILRGGGEVPPAATTSSGNQPQLSA